MHLEKWGSWLVALALTGSTGALAADPQPAALAEVEAQVRALGGEEHVEADLLEIKFRDDQLIRLRDGMPTDLAGRGLRAPAASVLMKAVSGGKWMRSHEVPEEALERLQAEGLKRTAEPQPDLNLYFRVRLPAVLDAQRIAAAFRELPEVEAVYRVPRPVETPLAPDYYSISSGSYQQYQDEAPVGIDGRYAQTVPGARGTGVKICDIEYSFNAAHVDLGTVTVIGPAGVDPFSNDNHGTAVLGVYGSLPNGEGTLGIAHDAQKLFAYANTRSGGYNVGAAVTTCAANLGAGDVIVIEQQLSGPLGGTNYVPSEWYKPWYDAIKAAVAANKVVVAAAGNGGQNLDAPIYSTGNGGHYPFLPQNDSGAIIVGAGQSPVYGPSARAAHSFSNYGSTVDLQGWGDRVTTTGYGGLYSSEGVNRWYTGTFSGTSSATPIVAGAVASVQGASIAAGQGVLSPSAMRSLLLSTGTPQAGSNHIGPLPNLRQALSALSITNLWISPESPVRPAEPSTAQADSTAVAAGNGLYLVVWSDFTSGAPDILAARVKASDGALLDTTPIFIGTAPGAQVNPAVTFDGTHFLVVWEDHQSLPRIFGARVRAVDGAVVTPPFLVSQTPPGPFSLPQTDPAVAFDAASSNYLVTWSSFFHENGSVGSGILGIRIQASSGALVEPQSFLVGRDGRDGRVASANGSFLVSWTRASNIEAARVSGASGSVLDATPISLAATAANEHSSAVAAREGRAAGDGEFLVVWTGADNTLRGRRLRASDGATLEASDFVVGAAAVVPASVTYDGQDYRVAWQGTRDGARKVLTTRVSADGEVASDAEAALSEVSSSSRTKRVGIAATSVGRFLATYLQHQPTGNLHRARMRLAKALPEPVPCESLTPLLVLDGRAESTLECGPGTYSDAGARAFDGCGNPIQVRAYNAGNDSSGPGPLLGSEGSYTVSYSAWDAQGQTVSASRTVNVEDRTAPTLALQGPASMTHTCGSPWVDPGVQAQDACYGNVSTWGWHVGEVNGWAEGTYTVTYFVADGSGNASAPVTRTVEVIDCPW
ncbi:immunoglobulin-like domain-containing protein [Hyalangium gracile]|uniref:immunoglobulin-like domain-containing protein n=1 Tax=Hyalangium gracile TaxID=394092 RepID=UPI001CCFF7EE|nr:immunoglobulin-like domain-containing protein [Hyalangium gracile]